MAGQRFPAFPYEAPYGIQLDLMRAVYGTLDAGGVGIFESPTGTVSVHKYVKNIFLCICENFIALLFHDFQLF